MEDNKLLSFVTNWNQGNSGITFSLVQGVGADRPSSVEVRFSPSRHFSLYSCDRFPSLIEEIEQRSRRLMFVASDERMFHEGILDIKIAAEQYQYSDHLIRRTLDWLGNQGIPT